MNRKKLLLISFALVALAQLFVPWQMIRNQAGIAETGTDFKFKIKNNRSGASIRGRYIWLRFDEDHFKITNKKEWTGITNAYALFNKDSTGFAKIESVTKDIPENSTDWVQVKVIQNREDSMAPGLIYPFNKYYIEDTNHKTIDSILRNGLNDSLKSSYLKIHIKENQFLIDDLLLDGVPLEKMIRDLKN